MKRVVGIALSAALSIVVLPGVATADDHHWPQAYLWVDGRRQHAYIDHHDWFRILEAWWADEDRCTRGPDIDETPNASWRMHLRS